jgi:hypothetical protein
MTRRSLADKLRDLPPFCAVRIPSSGQPALVKRGEQGYWPRVHSFDVEVFNRRMGVTLAQAEAMLAGSMFGFDVPGADPLNYQERNMGDEI